MRNFLVITIAALALVLAGCSTKDEASTSPSPGATDTAAVTNMPGSAASPNAGQAGGGAGNAGGGAGSATSAPSGGATTVPENLPGITKEQLDKLDPNSTYEDLVKIVGGGNLKPIKEDSSKKTYELKVTDAENTFVDITYFSDGKISEKSIFVR